MGKMRLDILNADGDFVNEKVDIWIENTRLRSDRQFIGGRLAADTVEIDGVNDAADNGYFVEVDAPSYLPVKRVVNVVPGKVATIRVPVDIDEIQAISFPAFDSLTKDARRLLNDSPAVKKYKDKTGEALYSAFSNVERAGFLNLCAKCERMKLHDGRSVISTFTEVVEVKQDRFFVRLPLDVATDVDRTEAFNDAPGGLHKREGYRRAGSWKSDDPVGNLQLTFFTKPGNLADTLADVDLDDFNGFAHAYQVARNFFSGPTHPYNIQQLLKRREIDPGYAFQLRSTPVRPAGVAGAAGAD